MTDHVTHNLSKKLYRYMCQHIVGTEDYVKQVRLMNAVRDHLCSNDEYISITSGSYGEGLGMRGSDLDVMSVNRKIEVYNVKPHFFPNLPYLLMDTDDVKPGFTQLKLENNSRRNFSYTFYQLIDKHYLSSALWKQGCLTRNKEYTSHGPCISDKNGLYDFVECFHCKTWVLSAIQWITRSTNSWPSNNVKQNIIKHGVLFVPIGVKGSPKEDLEWRISFSIGEKLLVNTFTHTQLCCYALIKILLKDVITTFSECKELLCSYFLKTILFWVSEELSQSAWKPDNLIPCFMHCFNRLIYCVEYSICLHYFIPENNMFANKIEGRARKILLEKLYTLHTYGWRCILFSDQLFNFSSSMRHFNLKQQRWYIYDVKKANNSNLLRHANSCFRTGLNSNNVLLSSSFNIGIQKTVGCNKSSINYLYVYYMSVMCAVHAQCIPLKPANSNNKNQYRQNKSCICTLLQNVYHDIVSGWLMLASFFYKTKQYYKALHIIKYSLSKCTSEKLCVNTKMESIHHQLLELKSLQMKSIVRLWKFILIDDMTFEQNSVLIPDELKIEVDGQPLVIPSTAYACFLSFLCNYHLNNVRQCQDILQILQFVLGNQHIFSNVSIVVPVFNLLGITLQILGDTESACQVFKQSVEIFPDSSKNLAVKRLMLMS